ncbi:MAG: U32 family peptidase [Elusimicrobia bacterium]|nr:U32 family peptidase [Elusimicrobiota bacterium]
MPRPRYAIPFNGDTRLLKEALRSGQVEEVYFGGPPESNASHCPELRNVDGQGLKRALELCRAHHVRTNLLCNAYTLLFKDIAACFKLVRSPPKIDAVTISDPLAISTFRKELPQTELHASVIMNLDSCARIEAALKAGIRTVTLPLKLNRDAGFLTKAKRLKERHPRLRIKLIANHNCRPDCIFSPWHYMIESAGSSERRPSLKSPFHERIYGGVHACLDSCDSPAELIKLPFIRPEDVGHYVKNGYADVFKLVHRSWSSPMLRRAYSAYFARRHRGNLFEIVNTSKYGPPKRCDNTRFPADFARRVTTCGKACERCSYCEKIAARTVQRGRARPPP